MKNLRVSVVLEMAFDLYEHNQFTAKEIRERTNVSRSTFFRCLSDLRCHLQETRPYYEIDYDPVTGIYKFIKYKEEE